MTEKPADAETKPTTRAKSKKADPKIVMVEIEKLIPYSNNARTHSEEQVAQIAASIKRFGFTNPILTDGENGIIAGHGRLMAARKLGLKKAPTIELSHLSDTEKRAYIIADNKLALNSDWSISDLRFELAELEGLGFPASGLGFTPEEIDDMFKGFGDDELLEGFQEFDEEIETEHCCPKCGYTWSGKSERPVDGDKQEASVQCDDDGGSSKS